MANRCPLRTDRKRHCMFLSSHFILIYTKIIINIQMSKKNYFNLLETVFSI
jgi:hypothetical protein